MEGVEMGAVEVRKVETMGEFQPFPFHPLTSRQLMTSCVVWGLWVAVLLLKMTMQVISQDMDGTVSPCLLRWEWNKTISELLLLMGLRKCMCTLFSSDWWPCGSCRNRRDQCFLWDNRGSTKAFACQLEHGSQPPGGTGEHSYQTSLGFLGASLLYSCFWKCQMISLCAYLFNGLLANRCTLQPTDIVNHYFIHYKSFTKT